jgi:hypothetical protein
MAQFLVIKIFFRLRWNEWMVVEKHNASNTRYHVLVADYFQDGMGDPESMQTEEQTCPSISTKTGATRQAGGQIDKMDDGAWILGGIGRESPRLRQDIAG